jgi:hypothetical protein
MLSCATTTPLPSAPVSFPCLPPPTWSLSWPSCSASHAVQAASMPSLSRASHRERSLLQPGRREGQGDVGMQEDKQRFTTE